MIKDTGSKFNDYSMFKQILLHWGYESTQKGFFKWVDQEILKKQKKKWYSKEKAADYYLKNKETRKKVKRTL